MYGFVSASGEGLADPAGCLLHRGELAVSEEWEGQAARLAVQEACGAEQVLCSDRGDDLLALPAVGLGMSPSVGQHPLEVLL